MRATWSVDHNQSDRDKEKEESRDCVMIIKDRQKDVRYLNPKPYI